MINKHLTKDNKEIERVATPGKVILQNGKLTLKNKKGEEFAVKKAETNNRYLRERPDNHVRDAGADSLSKQDTCGKFAKLYAKKKGFKSVKRLVAAKELTMDSIWKGLYDFLEN